jgi:hypothetical protein
MLTGTLTGTGKRDGGGNAPSGNRRSGKPLFSTSGAEAERLGADPSADGSEVIRIKTDDAQREMIDPKGATPLTIFGSLSLVAGNVTGGGGKATKKRPIGTVTFE